MPVPLAPELGEETRTCALPAVTCRITCWSCCIVTVLIAPGFETFVTIPVPVPAVPPEEEPTGCTSCTVPTAVDSCCPGTLTTFPLTVPNVTACFKFKPIMMKSNSIKMASFSDLSELGCLVGLLLLLLLSLSLLQELMLYGQLLELLWSSSSCLYTRSQAFDLNL